MNIKQCDVMVAELKRELARLSANGCFDPLERIIRGHFPRMSVGTHGFSMAFDAKFQRIRGRRVGNIVRRMPLAELGTCVELPKSKSQVLARLRDHVAVGKADVNELRSLFSKLQRVSRMGICFGLMRAYGSRDITICDQCGGAGIRMKHSSSKAGDSKSRDRASGRG